MKKRKIKIMSVAEIATLMITIGGFVWVGGFQYSAIQRDIHYMKEDIQELKTDVRRIDGRLERIEDDIHNLDVRVNILEQRKR